MEALVYAEPWDVRRRLRDLSLSVEVFQTAGRAGHLGKASCTPNDPLFIPGTVAWWRTVRSLREQLSTEGWEKDDPDNYALTIRPDGAMGIVVSTGDEATGLRHLTPKTKSAKGQKSILAVEVNRQHELFSETLPERLVNPSSDMITYVYLINIQPGLIRSELSLPRGLDRQGHIDNWKERIIIPETKFDPEGIPGESDDFGPEIVVDVRRRA